MRENDDTLDYIYSAGPLNLNRQTRQAHTVMGAELPLDGKSFDALFMLASHEGEPQTLEQLCSAIWDGDGSAAASSSLNNLAEQVNTAGQGFMWIEFDPGSGYTFRTRWANHWRRRSKLLPIPDADNPRFTTLPGRRRRPIVPLLAGAVAIAAAVTASLVLPGLLTRDETVVFEDSPPPLADPQLGNGVAYPIVTGMAIPAGAVDVQIPLQNPDGNPCYFIFEIALADTGEILYISEPVLPGASIGAATLNRPVEAGEHKAMLQIRAYDLCSNVEIEQANVEYPIVAE